MEKQAELIREKDELDRLMAEMKLEDEDKKRWYANKHLKQSVNNALQLGSCFIFNRCWQWVMSHIGKNSVALNTGSSLSSQTIIIYFGS